MATRGSRSAARRAAVGDILSSPASTSAWVGAGIAYPSREQRRGPDERAGSAVADRHGPAIGCGDEDPDHPGDDQLQKPGVLTLPVRHRPGGNRYRAGARRELVENVTWKLTQVRPRQRKAHLSIHGCILSEVWKQSATWEPRLRSGDLATGVTPETRRGDRSGRREDFMPMG